MRQERKERFQRKRNQPTEEMCHDSDEEIEKVNAKGKKKMSQKYQAIATAKSSPYSERLVEEEKYKQEKGKRNVDMKEQERESELQTKASRGKLQKPYSQVKERERVKETYSGMKAKRPHSSEQASDVSKTDCEDESDSGNDSSEDGEDSEGKSSDEEKKAETDEGASTAPSEEEVKKKEKPVSHEKEKAQKEGNQFCAQIK